MPPSNTNKSSSMWPLALLGTLFFSFLSLRKSSQIKQENGEPVRVDDTINIKRNTAPRKSPAIAEMPPSPSEYTGPDRRKDDTPPWKKKLEIRAFWGGLALLVVNIGLLLVNVSQMRSTEKAAIAATDGVKVSQKQLELTERPWVFVTDATVIGPLTFDKTGAHVTFRIILHNGGPSPATNALIVPRLYPLPLVESAQPPVERLCDATSYASSNHGLLIFPNTDSPPQTLEFGMNRKEIEEGTHSGALVVTPLICVLYRPTFRKDGPGYSSGVQYALWPTIWPDKTTFIPESKLPLVRNGFFAEEAH